MKKVRRKDRQTDKATYSQTVNPIPSADSTDSQPTTGILGANNLENISLIFGTRPEAIKLCPLVLELRKHPEFTPHVCVTGQHRQILDQVLKVFAVTPDVGMSLTQQDQTLAGLPTEVRVGPRRIRKRT